MTGRMNHAPAARQLRIVHDTLLAARERFEIVVGAARVQRTTWTGAAAAMSFCACAWV